MKEQILEVAYNLENGLIDTDKAKSLLLGLFGVTGTMQPLNVQRVDKMIKEASMEAYIACGGIETEWREWWAKRNKVNINKF